MTEREPSRKPSRYHGGFLVLFVTSFFPLLFLKLDEASQLASALALPLAVLLAALTTVTPIRQSRPPFPWRRYLVTCAYTVALLGGIGITYAIWSNTRDIPISHLVDSKPSEPLKDGGYIYLPIPGKPPERGHLTLVVSLTNVNKTGDCEQTATLGFTPVLDDRQMEPILAQPAQEINLSLMGTAREAKVKITLDYEFGNRNCAVNLHIDKAILHD